MDAFKDRTYSEVDDFLRIPSVQKLLKDSHHTLELDTLTGRHLFVSTEVMDLYGYTPDEFIEINGWDLMHPEDVDVSLEARKALERGPVRMVLRGKHRLGKYIWTDVRMMLHNDLVSVIHAPLAKAEVPDQAFWEFIDPFL